MMPDKIPVILLHSSSDDQVLRDECKKLNVRFNLVKPVKAGELYYFLKNIHVGEIKVAAPQKVLQETPALVKTSKPATILVAEDVVTNMMLVKILISRLQPNVEIIEARNGLEAVAAVQQHTIDLVLMDVQMPELDGLDATRLIREDEIQTNTRIPIIALTAGALKEERERCLVSGMDDFLTKPIQPDALTAILKRYLSR